MAATRAPTRIRQSFPDLLSLDRQKSTQVALAGAAANSLLKRRGGSAPSLPMLTLSQPTEEERRASKLQELWNKDSILKLRHLPSQTKFTPNIGATCDCSEVGMVRMVNGKVRELRQQRTNLPSPASLVQLGKDMQHSIRVCTKAKTFIDLSMDGPLGTANKRGAVKGRVFDHTADVDNTADASLGEAEDAWAGLLKDLATPKSAKSLSGASPGRFLKSQSSTIWK